MFLAKYGHQDIVKLQERALMRDVQSWVDRLSDFHDEERAEAERNR